MCIIEFLSDDLRSQQKIDRIWKEAEMQMSRQVFLSSFCIHSGKQSVTDLTYISAVIAKKK